MYIHNKYLRIVWQPALLFDHQINQNALPNPTFRLTQAFELSNPTFKTRLDIETGDASTVWEICVSPCDPIRPISIEMIYFKLQKNPLYIHTIKPPTGSAETSTKEHHGKTLFLLLVITRSLTCLNQFTTKPLKRAGSTPT